VEGPITENGCSNGGGRGKNPFNTKRQGGKSKTCGSSLKSGGSQEQGNDKTEGGTTGEVYPEKPSRGQTNMALVKNENKEGEIIQTNPVQKEKGGTEALGGDNHDCQKGTGGICLLIHSKEQNNSTKNSERTRGVVEKNGGTEKNRPTRHRQVRAVAEGVRRGEGRRARLAQVSNRGCEGGKDQFRKQGGAPQKTRECKGKKQMGEKRRTRLLKESSFPPTKRGTHCLREGSLGSTSQRGE